jgi:hypothetical protein
MKRLLAPMVLAASLVVTAAVPAPALAANASWTQLSVGIIGAQHEPSLIRAADGKLHGAWVIENSPNDWSIASVVLSPAGKVLTRGWVVQHWYLLQLTPKIVPYAGGWAVVFNGSMAAANADPYSQNARYWATSTDGNTWTLKVGSLSSSLGGSLGIAATTEADGTLVTMQSFNNALQWHVGSDAATPSTTPDGVIPAPAGSAMLNPQLVRSADGSIWAGWYEQFGTQQGYWAQQILPSVGAPLRAPGSYNPAQFNLPVQQTAMVARTGGGVYMAYCEASATSNCPMVGLWRVGAAKALTVPGSVFSLGRVSASRVTLSGGPGGRLEIAFYNVQADKMYVVWTNHKVSAFSGARTFNPVKKNTNVNNLFIDGTKGPVDVVTNTQLPTSGAPTAIYHTQLLPALKITASAHSFSHKLAVKLTFKVTDVGDPVPGVKVTFDGKSSRTNAKGVAVIKLSKGSPKGKHSAVARVTNWQAASVAITTT